MSGYLRFKKGRHGWKKAWFVLKNNVLYSYKASSVSGRNGKKCGLEGGRVAEWFKALDLKSGGPWFKSSTLPLSGFVLGSPEFNSSTALCK